jgi:hypothetical protein
VTVAQQRICAVAHTGIAFETLKGDSSRSRKVTGSTPQQVIGFSSSPIPSSRTMTLGSTKPLTEMSNGNLPGSV